MGQTSGWYPALPWEFKARSMAGGSPLEDRMIESFALIPLTQGLFATVDLEDLERAKQFKWYPQRARRIDGSERIYVSRNIPARDGKKTMEKLHRFILNAAAGLDVDHVNGDGLDNRKSNLRECSRSQNNGNSNPRAGTSTFKGVSWHGQRNKWRAQIRANGKRQHLGLFTNEVDAARAYDEAAIQHFGEFARLNFPGERHAQ
jgi:hypothetical protein